MIPKAKVLNCFLVVILAASVFAIHPAMSAQAQASEAGLLQQGLAPRPVTDGYGNVIEQGDKRFNYEVGMDGKFWKVTLDKGNHILGREELQASPYDPAKLKQTVPADDSRVIGFNDAAANGVLALPEWRTGFFGTQIGEKNIVVADIDHDGRQEMVMAGCSDDRYSDYDNFWYVVENTGPDTYAQTWISSEYQQPISRIEAADINGDHISEIFIGLYNGDFEVYDGSSLKLKSSFSTGVYLKYFRLADVDSDGVIEIVTTNETNIYVFSAVSHGQEWSGAGYGGLSLAVGNVDADPSLEIISSDGYSNGYVINGASHAVEWHYTGSDGFGGIVEVGDVDNDGKAEIAGTRAWYKVMIFNAETQSLGWEITTNIDLDALSIADVEGDGVPEILYGDRQWGSVFCYNGITHAKKWSITNPDSNVSDLAVGDVNSDGVRELMWASGAHSTGDDHLYVADTVSHLIEWQNVHIDGPLSAVDVGDVDDDGDPEIVMISYSSNAGYEDGVIHIFDAATHALEWQSTELPGIYHVYGVNAVVIADVDDDGQTEFVLSTDNWYNGIIQIYNGSTHQLERQNTTVYDGVSFTSLAVGDVDSDGHTEIIAGQEVHTSGAAGLFLVVFDGATATEVWKSPALDGISYDIELADVDSDNHVEMITSTAFNIYVFDGSTHQTKWSEELRALALEVADIDDDDVQEILVGENNGVIEAYQGNDYVLDGSFDVGSGNILGLMDKDLDQDGTPEWLVTNQSRLAIVRRATNTVLWQSASLGLSSSGYLNQLNVANIDNDDELEIVLGSSLGLYQFDVVRNQQLLSVFLPLIHRTMPGIHGIVNFVGNASQGVPLELQFYNGSSWLIIDSTTTNKNGEYQFTSAASLLPGQKYVVVYLNPSPNSYNGRLFYWETQELTSYQAGESVNIGNFDIADTFLSSPYSWSYITLPQEFIWAIRDFCPEDDYQFFLFDPDGTSEFFSPQLGYEDSYILDSLPAGFYQNSDYGWTLYIHHPDGGFGFIYYYYSIAFSSGSSTNIKSQAAGPLPNWMDVDEFLNRQEIP